MTLSPHAPAGATLHPGTCSRLLRPVLWLLLTLWLVQPTAAAEAGSGWRCVAPPASRGMAAMAYDSVRQRLVLFGGYSNLDTNSHFGDTWEWDGSAWTQVATSGPSPRNSAAMAFDSQRGRIVLFGGHSGTWDKPVYHGDTWEWDGTAWTQAATEGPGPRRWASLAYDAARGKTVLYGGYNAAQKYGDTWTWDGAAWTKLEATGPGPRYGAAMAYDSQREKVVLFGGTGGGYLEYFEDTWEWDGQTWTQVAASGPSARFLPSMAFDSTRGKMVLFGGYFAQPVVISGDTWEWNGSAWVQVSTTGPDKRQGAAIAYDAARRQTVLFGGYGIRNSNAAFHGDTWAWDGTEWTVAAKSAPEPRYEHAMTYNSARGTVVMYGGSSQSVQRFGDTWEWDGRDWTLAATTGPAARSGMAMAYDSARDRVVLFGGAGYVEGNLVNFGDTWEWDGNAWTQVASTGPEARTGSLMTYDSARGKVLLYGGRLSPTVRLSDTWEWDGSAWTRRDVISPGAFTYPGMTFDSQRNKVVLFGRGPNYTWEWDGNEWTLVHTTGPKMISLSGLTYDNSRGKVIAAGYLNESTLQTWEWDGYTWTLSATSGPSRRGLTTIQYDSARQNTVLFGGSVDSFGAGGDTWIYTGPTGYTLGDAFAALKCAAGLAAAPEGSPAKLDMTPSGPSAGRVDMEDAIILVRKASGLEPNP